MKKSNKLKNQMHNIYVDASLKSTVKKGSDRDFKNTTCGIGVYDSKTTFGFSLKIDCLCINKAESYAVAHAVRYAKHNGLKQFRIFTDSRKVYDEEKDNYDVDGIELIWIPREKNKDADYLAGKCTTGVIQTTEHLEVKNEEIIHTTKTVEKTTTAGLNNHRIIKTLQSYSVTSRYNLIKHICKDSKTKEKVFARVFESGKRVKTEQIRMGIYKLIFKLFTREELCEINPHFPGFLEPTSSLSTNAIVELLEIRKKQRG